MLVNLEKYILVPVMAATSYAIYLTHVLSSHALVKLFEWLQFDTIAIKICLIILVACIVGYLFYKLIELPIMRWRSRAIPSYRRNNLEAEYANTRH